MLGPWVPMVVEKVEEAFVSELQKNLASVFCYPLVFFFLVYFLCPEVSAVTVAIKNATAYSNSMEIYIEPQPNSKVSLVPARLCFTQK